MDETGRYKPSRSCGERSCRKGAVFVRETGPLPHGRSSERSFATALLQIVIAAGFVLALVSASLAQEVKAEQVAGRVVEAESVDVDAGVAGIGVPDMTFCQLYDLRQFGRVGSVVGLALATTSWNVGTADLMWFAAPDPRHPFIVQNLYRLESGRFEQIGQSWVKHGFFALGDQQCGTCSNGDICTIQETCSGGGCPRACTYEPDTNHSAGEWLGMGCTDTYTAGLNANTIVLGPREEVNPWTAEWTYAGSHLSTSHSHDGVEGIDHRLQVHDGDLRPTYHPTAEYIAEGFYIVGDDLDVMNNAAWKSVTVTGTPGGTWTFGMSGEFSAPTIGFAIDAWEGASQTIMAEEIPVSESSSPDGRIVLASKATDLGGGLWHYEYAMLNIDLSRKGCGFSVPIDPATTVTNIGFHAPESHGESYSNMPWTMEVSDSCPGGGQCVRWSTTDNNPLRWGTLYNFRFDADVAPAGGVVAGAVTPTSTVTLGLCEPGGPMSQRYGDRTHRSGGDPNRFSVGHRRDGAVARYGCQCAHHPPPDRLWRLRQRGDPPQPRLKKGGK